jgi:Resolvase, N terminal domain
MTAPVHHNLVGLARVSTDAQDARLQRDALAAAGRGRTFEEKASSRKAGQDRPALAVALDYVRPGDTLVVWKFDRLGRSAKQLLTIADDLHERGVGLRILTGSLAGTYTPIGEGKHPARETRVRTRRSRRPASTRSLIVTWPSWQGAFRKLDAVAVLTARLLPAPLFLRGD